MYVAAGFGVLTKGPVAVFLPAVVFFIYLASQRRLGDLRRMMLPHGRRHRPGDRRRPGTTWCTASTGGNTSGRSSSARTSDAMPRRWASSRAALLFYIPVMLADLFPWSLLIPLALWWAIRASGANRVVRLLVVWIAAIVVVFFAVRHEGGSVHPPDRHG